MSREFSKVSPALWQSKRFTELASDDARYLYLYLLTNDHQNSAGIYRLRDGYACEDLRWPLERYVKARALLVEADMVHFDDAESVVLITRWFKHNAPMSESHYTGVVRIIERIQSSLVTDAMAAAIESWERVQAEKLKKKVVKSDASPQFQRMAQQQGWNGARR